MRIALCLSGQPRTWRHTRESLLAFFAGHEVDIFLHSWAGEDDGELAEVVGAYRPVAQALEPRPAFRMQKRMLADHFPHRPPLSVFDMNHSTAASLALACSRPGYDLVVRARFDALFDGVWSGEAPPAGAVVVPAGYPDPMGCNDQFAIGAPQAMAAYAGVADWLPRALPHVRGHSFAPEAVLRAYLEQVAGLTVLERPIAMRLLREGHVGRAFADLGDDPLFHAAKHEAWEAEAAAAFPDLLEHVDFGHDGRTPLALDRGLAGWIDNHEPREVAALLAAPWPERLRAIDGFIADEAGDPAELDEDVYQGVRLMCAMLLHRMDHREPVTAESYAVHALSANGLDMRRAAAWRDADPKRLEAAAAALRGSRILGRAYAYAPALQQQPAGVWRLT